MVKSLNKDKLDLIVTDEEQFQTWRRDAPTRALYFGTVNDQHTFVIRPPESDKLYLSIVLHTYSDEVLEVDIRLQWNETASVVEQKTISESQYDVAKVFTLSPYNLTSEKLSTILIIMLSAVLVARPFSDWTEKSYLSWKVRKTQKKDQPAGVT